MVDDDGDDDIGRVFLFVQQLNVLTYQNLHSSPSVKSTHSPRTQSGWMNVNYVIDEWCCWLTWCRNLPSGCIMYTQSSFKLLEQLVSLPQNYFSNTMLNEIFIFVYGTLLRIYKWIRLNTQGILRLSLVWSLLCKEQKKINYSLYFSFTDYFRSAWLSSLYFPGVVNPKFFKLWICHQQRLLIILQLIMLTADSGKEELNAFNKKLSCLFERWSFLKSVQSGYFISNQLETFSDFFFLSRCWFRA